MLSNPAIRIPILSGKGGVGKTTLALGVALALKQLDYHPALLDLDLENPSMGTACGLSRKDLIFIGELITPPKWEGIPIMSLSLLPLAAFVDTPTLVNEQRKREIIEHLFIEIEWGDSDILIIDMPPGSGTEVRGLLGLEPTTSILITSPQKLSEAAIRRVIAMTQEYSIPIMGLVENNINRSGGDAGQRICTEYKFPLLGRIGWARDISDAMENNQPFYHKTFTTIAEHITNTLLPKIDEGVPVSEHTDGLRSPSVVPDGGGASQQEVASPEDQGEVSGVSTSNSRDGDSPPVTGDN